MSSKFPIGVATIESVPILFQIHPLFSSDAGLAKQSHQQVLTHLFLVRIRNRECDSALNHVWMLAFLVRASETKLSHAGDKYS